MRRSSVVLALFSAVTLPAAFAQNVISAKSGLIHMVEGQAYIGDKALEPKKGTFDDLKVNQVLRTEDGRVEVLLTPGAFLRLAEASSVKMVSNKLSETKVDVLTGSVILECAELLDGNSIALTYRDRSIAIRKPGLFRIDADQNMLRVYEGEVIVTTADGTQTVKKGQLTDLGATVLATSKFNAKIGDDFYRWAQRRASYISMANVSAAKTMKDSGSSYRSGFSNWYYNPFYGLYTFVPSSGRIYSPFGFYYWSPYTVYSYINPYRNSGYGNGYNNSGYSTGARSGFDPSVGYNVGTRSAGFGSYSGSSGSGMHSGSIASAPSVASTGGDRGGAAGGASAGTSSGGGRTGGR